jgi:hypothetical protein
MCFSVSGKRAHYVHTISAWHHEQRFLPVIMAVSREGRIPRSMTTVPRRRVGATTAGDAWGRFRVRYLMWGASILEL